MTSFGLWAASPKWGLVPHRRAKRPCGSGVEPLAYPFAFNSLFHEPQINMALNCLIALTIHPQSAFVN